MSVHRNAQGKSTKKFGMNKEKEREIWKLREKMLTIPLKKNEISLCNWGGISEKISKFAFCLSIKHENT